MSAPDEELGVEAIVVAAGASRRAGTDKLAAVVGGRPLLAWTLDAVAAAPGVARIVVVSSSDGADALRRTPWLPPSVAAVVPGGARRHESVAAGVAELDRLGAGEDAIVLVHDGARPAAPPALFAAVAAAVAEHGAAVPVIPVGETLKRVEGDRILATVPRDGLAAAQTPQGARLRLLRDAFRRFPPHGPETWTDEAALLEACSIPVHAIAGHPDNLKVTLPADLDRAARLLAPADPSAPTPRIGFGHDAHPFGPGERLALGGVEIAAAPRLRGHSDGDAALHAVADALLGAAGLGDLGRIFPADDRTPRGAASAELLEAVVTRLADAGLRASSVDLVIVAGRPRLGPYLDAMRERIAALVGLPAGRVSVKASSGNLVGPEGAGRGIAARAVAVVERAR